MFCERNGSKHLFRVSDTPSKGIRFSESSSNTRYRIYSDFHSFQCRQYPKDSKEDKQQIQELADHILQFCTERMHIGKALHERPLDHMHIGEAFHKRPPDHPVIEMALHKRQLGEMDIGHKLPKRQRSDIDEYNFTDFLMEQSYKFDHALSF